jgi:two-component system, chemotaxis family, protein-glutamate methylesterase/glutaminase
MGDDGAEGLGSVKASGGMTIAQSEQSCVVFGMPKAAIERGYATRIVDLESMASTLMTLAADSGRGEASSGHGPGGKAAGAAQN